MASTYSTSLKLELIGNGDQPGTWGTTTNNNLGTLLEQAITGVQSIVMTNTNYTLTNFNGASDEARNAVLYVTGTNSQVRSIIAPSVNKVYIIRNATTGGYAIDIKTSGGAGLSVANGSSAIVYCDGTDFFYGTTADKVSLGVITSPTGSEIIPVGTTAQRDSPPITGYFRYNSTLNRYESTYSNPGKTISSITKNVGTNVASLTTNTAHGLITGDYVIVSGAVDTLYNGNFQITVTSANSFNYTMTAEPASNAFTVGSYVNVYWQSMVTITGNTGSLVNPVGTTAQRDSPASAGYSRYNTTLSWFEGYNGADWALFGAATDITGSEIIPVGTTAQRDAIPVIGYFRYNSTISGFEGVSANAGVTISTITKSGTTATLTTATNHELATNDYVIITGAVSSDYNGTFQITVTSDTEFTYTMATTPASDASVVGTYQNIYWGSIGGGATGAGGNQIFVENEQTVTNSYTIPSGKNASSTGDITINTGVTVTVPSESRWVIL
jgi:hypothetical protein